VQYVCNTFGGGPDDFERYVQIYQGDWFGLIEQGDTIATVQDKIGSNVGSNCIASDVRILEENNVSPGNFLVPRDFYSPTVPLCNLKPEDAQFLTYVVYQRTKSDRNQSQAEVRMKSSWKWDCSPTPDNPFFPMQAEYEVWNNFGNIELISFDSTKYGTVEETLAKSRFNYTIQNLCNVRGEVLRLDRQLCARECDSSQDDDWSCPSDTFKKGCVMNGDTMEPCDAASTTLPAGGSTLITDMYDDLLVYPTYEFQIRLPITRVEFGSNDMIKNKGEVRSEAFEFCAMDTGGSGGGGSSDGGGGGDDDDDDTGSKFALCGVHHLSLFSTQFFVSNSPFCIHHITSQRINQSFPAPQWQCVTNLAFRRRRLMAAPPIAAAHHRVGVKMEKTGTPRNVTSGGRMP